MKIHNFQDFQKQKENEGIAISEKPKIIYKGIDRYGRHLYEYIECEKPKSAYIVINPELAPIMKIAMKDAKKRDKDLIQRTQRKRGWKNYLNVNERFKKRKEEKEVKSVKDAVK